MQNVVTILWGLRSVIMQRQNKEIHYFTEMLTVSASPLLMIPKIYITWEVVCARDVAIRELRDENCGYRKS